MPSVPVSLNSSLSHPSLRKFVKRVDHVTFSGQLARARRTPVLYVTERCVFALTPEHGLELTEIAPGIGILYFRWSA
jgi:propionate CoA-transferase